MTLLNNIAHIRATTLKSRLVDLGLYALSHGQWHWIPAIDAIIRREVLQRA
jgi:hypothetical protein